MYIYIILSYYYIYIYIPISDYDPTPATVNFITGALPFHPTPTNGLPLLLPMLGKEFQEFVIWETNCRDFPWGFVGNNVT